MTRSVVEALAVTNEVHHLGGSRIRAGLLLAERGSGKSVAEARAVAAAEWREPSPTFVCL